MIMKSYKLYVFCIKMYFSNMCLSNIVYFGFGLVWDFQTFKTNSSETLTKTL